MLNPRWLFVLLLAGRGAAADIRAESGAASQAIPALGASAQALTPVGALNAARQDLYALSNSNAQTRNVAQGKITLAARTEYFRSPAFRDWVAAEKAAGRQVFWLKDIDKTQAAGDIFTYFFQWRAENDKFSSAQNDVMKAYLKTVVVTDPALQAELSAVDANNGRANGLLVIKLWRSKEHGGEGIAMMDFWGKIFWPTQIGLTKDEKLAEVTAFAPDYARRVYPGVPEDNRALADAGVEVVAVSNGDEELAVAVASQLGLRPENIVGSNLIYDDKGLSTGVNHAYEVTGADWATKPQPGKHLLFHYWIFKNKSRFGWTTINAENFTIAGADGDSASTDGGMWVYFPNKGIGNFMVNTPHEPGRVFKSLQVAARYGWGANQFFTLQHSPDSPSDWDDIPPKR